MGCNLQINMSENHFSAWLQETIYIGKELKKQEQTAGCQNGHWISM